MPAVKPRGRRWSAEKLAAVLAAVVMVASLVVACQAKTQDSGSAASAAPLPLKTSASPAPVATFDQRRSDWLAERLRSLVDQQRFADVVDVRTGVPPTAVPNVDAALVELDAAGRPVAAANTLLDDEHPHGVAVPVGADLAATGVRWTHWSNTLWAERATGSPGFAGAANGPIEFMAPYPASVFKLMVAFGVVRLVDRGSVRLEADYGYEPGPSGCPAGLASGRHPVSWWLDSMITYSDNHSACAMLHLLHDRGAVDSLNATFRWLGLSTLRIVDTSSDGGGWSFDGLTMTGLDTARLLLLFTDAPGTLWRTPTGTPVTSALLTGSSRAVIRGLLAQQGLNQALSRANWCGQTYPPVGIPQRVAQRWVDPATGAVSVHGRAFGGDIRPCNASAEVEFAHKTGLVPSAGADVGVVTALPGAPPRRYVVAVFSNLGCTLVDSAAPTDGTCRYTGKLATLGAGIDALMTYAAARSTAHLVG